MERTSSLDIFRGSADGTVFTDLNFLDGQEELYEKDSTHAASSSLLPSNAVPASLPASSASLPVGQRPGSKLLHGHRLTSWPQAASNAYSSAVQPVATQPDFLYGQQPASAIESQTDSYTALLADDKALGFADDCFRRESDLFLPQERLALVADFEVQPTLQLQADAHAVPDILHEATQEPVFTATLSRAPGAKANPETDKASAAASTTQQLPDEATDQSSTPEGATADGGIAHAAAGGTARPAAGDAVPAVIANVSSLTMPEQHSAPGNPAHSQPRHPAQQVPDMRQNPEPELSPDSADALIIKEVKPSLAHPREADAAVPAEPAVTALDQHKAALKPNDSSQGSHAAQSPAQQLANSKQAPIPPSASMPSGVSTADTRPMKASPSSAHKGPQRGSDQKRLIKEESLVETIPAVPDTSGVSQMQPDSQTAKQELDSVKQVHDDVSATLDAAPAQHRHVYCKADAGGQPEQSATHGATKTEPSSYRAASPSLDLGVQHSSPLAPPFGKGKQDSSQDKREQ